MSTLQMRLGSNSGLINAESISVLESTEIGFIHFDSRVFKIWVTNETTVSEAIEIFVKQHPTHCTLNEKTDDKKLLLAFEGQRGLRGTIAADRFDIKNLKVLSVIPDTHSIYKQEVEKAFYFTYGTDITDSLQRQAKLSKRVCVIA
ncbi:hypothetical protein D5018_13260 [Parashewanella curva]|uniref:Uncharacterized protein n=1 Tax=Parashewanella curva TaxID=2338552 RepID=A0A3L8PVA0_9GAMM|nr:hypothetical protein [Parashewanella curva]RLV59244.1 hypothetical protein D5018_13260 [Parashewanella curva]